jgi:hypothetical protein
MDIKYHSFKEEDLKSDLLKEDEGKDNGGDLFP